MKTYFKFLSRNRMYTAINVFGLSISLTFVIIIGLYTLHERSMDDIHTKADRIYALCYTNGGNASDGSHWRIQEKLKSRYPEIESTCCLVNWDVILKTGTDELVMKKALFADSTFFSMFDFELTQGDRRTALDDPKSVVLTEETARLLFGATSPMGKNITLNGDIHLTVTGVMKRMRNSCIGKDADMVGRFENMNYYNASLTDEGMTNASGSSLFILTKPGTDLTAKVKDMDEYFKTFFWWYNMPGHAPQTVLIPLKKLYLSGSDSRGGTSRGDSKLIGILFSVALVILLFSVMNYVNLTVAQSGFRAREMAMRRLLGSRREGIIGRLVAESIVLCAMSMAVALVLSYVLMPYAARLLDSEVTMAAILQPLDIVLVVLGVLLIGLSAGVFPAIVISAAKPIEVVRGTFRRRTKMVFGKVFITLQNAITIILIAVSLTMSLQVKHLIDAPLGYDPTNLIVIENRGDGQQGELFMKRVRALPCVKSATSGMGAPLFRGNNLTMNIQDKTISFQYFLADSAYMRTIGLKLMQDNGNVGASNFGKVYVNRQALAEEGLGLDAKSIKIDTTYTISGVVEDFKIGSVLSDQHPVVIFVNDEQHGSWMFTIKYIGDGEEALAQIRDIHKEIYHMDISYDRGMPFYENCLKEQFKQYTRISRIVELFTFVAIVISLLGLLAMSTYFIQQRRREIAVRKVFGSTNRGILARLLRTFCVYVLVAFVVSIPIIYYFMSDWLSEFNYRIALSPWIFVAAGLFCLVISLATVLFQSWQAANMNPVESIKEN